MAVSGRKYYASQRKADKKAENLLFDRQIESTNKDYDTQVFEQGRAYEDQYRDNAVQKEINKRQVAESMANLGLRDSGLNRTQQTAVQLSYGNNRASIDRQRQAGIDSLNFSRRQTIDAIEQNRTAAIANIDKTYDNLALQYDENKKAEAKQMVLSYLEMGATPSKKLLKTSGMSDSEYAAYKKYYDKLLSKAASKVTKSYNSNANNVKEETYKVRTAGGKGFDDQGNKVYYFYDEKGKKYTYPGGVNPYTGKPITGGYTAEELKEFGVWNGYQPKGVKYNGENYGKVSQYLVNGESVKINHQGHAKTIWQTKDGRLWVWDDNVGNYVRAYHKNGEFYFEEV